jgi:hypothetical protein
VEDGHQHDYLRTHRHRHHLGRNQLHVSGGLLKQFINRGAVAVNSPGMSEAIPRVWNSPVGLFIFTP